MSASFLELNTEPNFLARKRQENREMQKHISEYCKKIPRLQRKYSNHQIEKVYIRKERQ